MKFSLKLAMDNAAFEDSMELPAVLMRVADAVKDGGSRGTVRDTNGNTVGEWKITD